MTIVATTSPGFGRYGRVPGRLAEKGWTLVRCVDASKPDGGLAEHLAEVDFLVAGLVRVTGEILDAAPKLKAVLKHGVGVDSIDIPACTARGVPVLNAPGANAAAVAELAIGMMFSFAAGTGRSAARSAARRSESSASGRSAARSPGRRSRLA
jgi:D-3-phosphoglycerate dehydrogenase